MDFGPYYDAIHKPYFYMEHMIIKNLPFRLPEPTNLSSHAKYLPFMKIELPLVFISAYLVVCYIGRHRKSRFDHPWFKFAVNLYNAFCVALSAFMTVTIFIETQRLGYTWFNNYIDESIRARNLAKALSIFYLSKYPELLDTVIMAIKGNTRQISFLHIYHHTSVILIFYTVISSSPYSEAYFCALQNCAVHTLMYSYYLLTSMKTGVFFTSKIKKYMTMIQMVFSIHVDSICTQCGSKSVLLLRLLYRTIQWVSYRPMLFYFWIYDEFIVFIW